MAFTPPDSDITVDESSAPQADAKTSQPAQPDSGFTPPASDSQGSIETLAKDKNYDPYAEYAKAQNSISSGANPQAAQADAETAFQVFKHRYQNPDKFSFGGAWDSTKKAVGGLWDALKGAGKLAQNTKDLGSAYLSDVTNAVTGQPVDEQNEPYEAKRASAIASAAGQAGTGLASMGESAGTNVKDFAYGLFGKGLTDDELRDRFARKVMLHAQMPSEIASGGTLPAMGIPNTDQIAEQQFQARKDEAGGDPAKEAALKQQISDKINQDVGEQSGAIQMGAIPEPVFNNPVTRAASGMLLRGGGKMVGLASKAITPEAANLGAAASIFSHNPAAAAASLGSKWILKPALEATGETMSKAGNELISGVPEGGNLGQVVARKALQSMSTGAVTGAGFALSSDNPNDAVGSILGGAALGPAFLLDPAELSGAQSRSDFGAQKAAEFAKANRYDILRQFGDSVQYGDEALDGDHEDAMKTLSKSDQDAINTARGFFAGMTTADGNPVRIYALTPDMYGAVASHATGQGENSRGFYSDGTIYLNAGYDGEGQASRTNRHETGHLADALAQTIGSRFAQELRTNITDALHDDKGNPVPEFKQFIDSYASKPGMDKYLKGMNDQQRSDYLQSEFVAETVNHILTDNSIGEFAVKLPFMDRVRQGVSDTFTRMGLFPSGSDPTFNWKEIPQVTSRMRDLLGKIGGDALQRAKDTSPLPTASSEPSTPPSPSGSTPPPKAAPTPEPYSDIGLTQAQIDAVRDSYVSPDDNPPAAVRANQKRGIQGKSADKVAEERGNEWDQMFSAYADYLRNNNLASVTNPIELRQAVINYWLHADQPSPTIRPASERGFGGGARGSTGSATPGIPESTKAGALSEAPEAPENTSSFKTKMQIPALSSESTPVSSEDVATRAQQAEDAAKASPEYAGKKKDSTRAEMVKTARIGAILDAAHESAGGDSSLLQGRQMPDGSTIYAGRIDPAIPAHKALLDEMGANEDTQTAIGKLDGGIGKTVFIDYKSAPKTSADISGAQRAEEQAESTASDRIKGAKSQLQQNKAIMPIGFQVYPSGKSVMRGFSPDKWITNVGKLMSHMRGQGMETGYNGINDPRIIADMRAYAANHANGYRGDGSAPVQGASINPDYSPREIPRDRFNILNAGLNLDESTSIDSNNANTRERALEAQYTAAENNWPVDEETGDTNPLRALINKSGKFVSQNTKGKTRTGTGDHLESVVENISPDLITDVRDAPNGEQDIVRPIGFQGNPAGALAEGAPRSDYARAGFMPEDENSPEIHDTATKLGVKYDGRIDVPGREIHQFTDQQQGPSHKATFTVRGTPTEDAIANKLKTVREGFGGNFMPEDAGEINASEFGNAEDNAKTEAQELIGSGKARLKMRDGKQLLITSSSKPDVAVQITRLDRNGDPLGDIEIAHGDEAALNRGIEEVSKYVLDNRRPDLVDSWQGRLVLKNKRKPFSYQYETTTRDANGFTVPKGFDSIDGNTATYSRPLTQQEISDYELRPVGAKQADGGVKFMPDDEQSNGFHSKLAQVVEDKIPNRASGKQILATLDPARGSGVKKEELEFLGIPQYLEGKESVSKKDLLDHIKANSLQLGEVTKGDEQNTASKKEYDDYESGLSDRVHAQLVQEHKNEGIGDERSSRMADKLVGMMDPRAKADYLGETDKFLKLWKDSLSEPTKFSQYKTPGGENYQEKLYTLPTEDGKMIARRKELSAIDRERPLTADEQAEYNDLRKRTEKGAATAFVGSHWSEPNVLFHTRQQDFKDAEGNKVRLIEEIQSDLHQKGRKEGYGRGYNVTDDRGNVIKQFDNESDANEYAKNNWSADNNISVRPRTGVLDAPFKKTWHELAFKHALRDAVNDGMDKIAWVTGEQAADRFDLSKQVDKITWNPETDQLKAEKDGRLIFDKPIPANELESTIGKDAARSLMLKSGISKPDGIRELADNVFGREMASSMPLQHVDSGMLSALHNDKVRDAVIPFLSVDVVNILRDSKSTPEQLFSNPDMVAPRLSADDRSKVGSGIVDAIGKSGALIRAELGGIKSGGRDAELLPALNASDLNSREVSGLLDSKTVFHSGSGSTIEKEGTSARPGAESLSSNSGAVGASDVSAAEFARLSKAHSEIIDANKGPVKQNDVSISGPELKVGSSGMRGFYDKIIPDFVRKYVKPWGGKVSKGSQKDGGGKLFSDGVPVDKFSGLSLDPVDEIVGAATNNGKILDSVVGHLPVDVVNDLTSNGIDPKQFASNPKMFSDRLPENTLGSISLGLRSALEKTGAQLRAGLDSAFKTGLDREVLPALRASDINTDVATGVSFPHLLRSNSGVQGGGSRITLSGAGSTTETGGRSLASGGGEHSSAEVAKFVDWHNQLAHSGDDVSNPKWWQVTITPQMREAVKAGQAMFMPQSPKNTTSFKTKRYEPRGALSGGAMILAGKQDKKGALSE